MRSDKPVLGGCRRAGIERGGEAGKKNNHGSRSLLLSG